MAVEMPNMEGNGLVLGLSAFLCPQKKRKNQQELKECELLPGGHLEFVETSRKSHYMSKLLPITQRDMAVFVYTS